MKFRLSGLEFFTLTFIQCALETYDPLLQSVAFTKNSRLFLKRLRNVLPIFFDWIPQAPGADGRRFLKLKVHPETREPHLRMEIFNFGNSIRREVDTRSFWIFLATGLGRIRSLKHPLTSCPAQGSNDRMLRRCIDNSRIQYLTHFNP